MSKELYQCTSEHDQTTWTIAHLKAGGAVSNVSLWLAGIDQPMHLLARVKSTLRAEGLAVASTVKKVCDAAGEPNDILTWSVQR